MKFPSSRSPVAAVVVLLALPATAQTPIGQWRDHYPYRYLIGVAEGANGQLWCATKTALFRYDPSSAEIDKFSKVQALNDVSIRTISWCAATQELAVGYDNGNLDLLATGSSRNLGDIKRSSILGDKGINHIRTEGSIAYLSCGFGIVVVDLSALEVRETWLIGPGGTQLEVFGTIFHGDSIHAATQSGVYSAWRYEPNLATFTNWHKHLEIPNPGGRFTAVASFGDDWFVNYRFSDSEWKDTLYYWNGTWNKVTAVIGKRNVSVAPSADGMQLVVAHDMEVSVLDGGLATANYYDWYWPNGIKPSQAIKASNGQVWVADRESALRNAASGDRFEPNGPSTVNLWRMDAAGGAVYAATGGVAGNWSNVFRKDGVLSLLDGSWGVANPDNDPLMAAGGNSFGGAVNDIMAIAVDPNDPRHAFAGSYDDGLIELRDRFVVAIYNSDNSTLENDAAYTVPKVNVAGLDFDANGNLWMSNPNAASCIAVRTRSGSWFSFTPGAVLSGNNLVSDVIAQRINNLKWFIRPRGNGLLVFDDKGTIEQSGDDQYKALNTFEGQGKLPSIDVYSIAEDLDGEVWVGTGKGIAVFYAPDAIFSGGDFDAQQILIEQDGNIQILLETEAVSAIAVDGANRKWLGTQSSGVFLVSPDGTEQLLHFDVSNSPLPSNNITAITIDGITGEVFIATDQGIMGYRSDATEGSLSATCATVFPNPVQPTYAGPIAITGLVRDSKVSITDVAGNLVYRTTSNGGEAIWPGTDMQGNRVSTGVYLALAVDPTGETKCNTRILVVR